MRRADYTAGSSCGVPGRIVSKETFAIRLILTIGARGTSYATGFISADAANFLMEEPVLTSEELWEKIIQGRNRE